MITHGKKILVKFPFSSIINNCFSLFLSPPPLTLIMMINTIAILDKTYEQWNSCEKKNAINVGIKN
jgi:hypothetical protein